MDLARMNNVVIGSLAVVGLGGLLASGTVSKLRDHIRTAVQGSSGPQSPFQQTGPGTNPLSPVNVGAGGDEAYGPHIGGGPLSAAGTAKDGTFTMSGVVNYWQGGRLQQAVIPGLKGHTFTYSTSDPSASIKIPSAVLASISQGLGFDTSAGYGP